MNDSIDHISESRARCRAAGMSEDQAQLRRLPAAEFQNRCRLRVSRFCPIAAQAHHVAQILHDVPHALCVADGDGVLLCVHTNWARAAELWLEPGFDWSEASCGTNAIGTSIASKTEIRVGRTQHLLRALHDIESYAVPVLNVAGDVEGVFALVGVTIAEEHARLLGYALRIARGSELLPTIAEAIRDRLTAILLNVQAYRRHPRSELLDAAVASGNRLAKLLDRMNESRVLELTPTDLALVVREAAAIQPPLELHVPASVHGLWDASRLREALHGLLLLARRCAQGNPVRVRVMEHPARVRIEIELGACIFDRDPGYQLARETVEAHGGSLCAAAGRVEVELPRSLM